VKKANGNCDVQGLNRRRNKAYKVLEIAVMMQIERIHWSGVSFIALPSCRFSEARRQFQVRLIALDAKRGKGGLAD
jgi:hypothetical protein